MTAYATKCIRRLGGRRAARTTFAIGAVSLGLVALSACDKPGPHASFTVGTSTESHEAADDCWDDGEPLGAERAQSCVESEDGVPVISVETGDTFRVGVDPEIADTGWLIFYQGQPYEAEPYTTTYETFAVDDLYQVMRQQSPGQVPERDTLRIVVAQVSEDYDMEEIWSSSSQEEYQEKLFGSFEGVWNLELEPQD
ncbi:hypothetical protein [Streptomyces sp. NBC_01803]|uniref:hypothetical protein n=1 Tax=Streptomyces sp. NBC_01803 TaxID=2975946 RepID=UPI002DDC353D|nr:hypothetical protein [Streptomyces sp. NBC_01803]WSA44769.1 hypothetical protein OIE51_11470 [Streptomyces sp. NBC_01803]